MLFRSQAGILGPVSTIFLGYFVLSEPITAMQIGGMILVIAAMWLLVHNEPTTKKSPNSQKSGDLDVEPLN